MMYHKKKYRVLELWKALAPKKQSLFCTIVFYCQGGTIQQAGCQIPSDRFTNMVPLKVMYLLMNIPPPLPSCNRNTILMMGIESKCNLFKNEKRGRNVCR